MNACHIALLKKDPNFWRSCRSYDDERHACERAESGQTLMLARIVVKNNLGRYFALWSR